MTDHEKQNNIGSSCLRYSMLRAPATNKVTGIVDSGHFFCSFASKRFGSAFGSTRLTQTPTQMRKCAESVGNHWIVRENNLLLIVNNSF